MARLLYVFAAAFMFQSCAATKIVTAPVKVVTGTIDAAVDVVD